MSRIDILKSSLTKKESVFDKKLQLHIDCVKQANGQPLNDKRNGRATLSKWERQNESLRTLDQSISKTKNAIDKEESKIAYFEFNNEVMPHLLLDFVAEGKLTQWRKHPRMFFVPGVEKARICWDIEKKNLMCRFVSQIPDQAQYAIFRDTFNFLKNNIK